MKENTEKIAQYLAGFSRFSFLFQREPDTEFSEVCAFIELVLWCAVCLCDCVYVFLCLCVCISVSLSYCVS
jgi:hypothetical protein